MFFDPATDLVICGARRDKVAEFAAADASFLKEMLVHRAAELEFTIQTRQGGARFIQRARRMRFPSQFLVRCPRLFFPQIARKLLYLFQVSHLASCRKVRLFPGKAKAG